MDKGNLNKLVTNYPVELTPEEVENLSQTLSSVRTAREDDKTYTGEGFVNVNNTNNVISLTNEANEKLNQPIPTKVSDLTDSASYQTVSGMDEYLTKTSASENLAPLSITDDIESLKNASSELTVEFEDIDLPKKVAVNLNQDFTEDEMAIARNNIGASKISYNNEVTDMTVTKEVVRPYMNTKYTATVGNDKFLLMSDAFTDGMVVKNNGSLRTQPIPESGDKFNICQYLLTSNGRNKTVLDKMNIGNNYKEYAGNIGFTTTTSGKMSICAFDSNQQLIYPTQCVNFSGPSTGVTNFIPFTFKEEQDKGRISYIGIKGASNGNATITHLFFIGKKE